MKTLRTLLLSAILIAGCSNQLEKNLEQSSENGEKKAAEPARAYSENFKNGFKEGVKRGGRAVQRDFENIFRLHLLMDQINLRNYYNLCENLASQYEEEGNKKEAEFYKRMALDARVELGMIEEYFKIAQ